MSLTNENQAIILIWDGCRINVRNIMRSFPKYFCSRVFSAEELEATVERMKQKKHKIICFIKWPNTNLEAKTIIQLQEKYSDLCIILGAKENPKIKGLNYTFACREIGYIDMQKVKEAMFNI